MISLTWFFPVKTLLSWPQVFPLGLLKGRPLVGLRDALIIKGSRFGLNTSKHFLDKVVHCAVTYYLCPLSCVLCPMSYVLSFCPVYRAGCRAHHNLARDYRTIKENCAASRPVSCVMCMCFMSCVQGWLCLSLWLWLWMLIFTLVQDSV